MTVEQIKALPNATKLVDCWGLTYAKTDNGVITLSSQLELSWKQLESLASGFRVM